MAQHWHRYPQSWTIQCQFQANTEDVCPFNLGTSPLYSRGWSPVYSEDEDRTTREPLNASPEQIRCQSLPSPRTISSPDLPVQSQLGAKLCQSEAIQSPSRANQRLIGCQSSTNPEPTLGRQLSLSFHQFVIPCQSVPIRANLTQSLPICANQSQSDSIHANPMPTEGQPLCFPVCQYVPILVNALPIHANSGQPAAKPRPFLQFSPTHQSSDLCKALSIHANPCQSKVNILIPTQFSDLPIQTEPCQSMPIHANPGQSSANFKPFLRAICPFNLGTSPLCGMVPSLLGG